LLLEAAEVTPAHSGAEETAQQAYAEEGGGEATKHDDIININKHKFNKM
jgi:hypothetical protein